jgi:NADH:ubiquinone oxidoreductase subunit 6 (subunit J)
MISFALYRLIHFIGIVIVFLALGGTLMHVLNGGTRETSRWRKPAAIGHGIALFVILLGGFGMMARMGVAHGMFPGWIWAKLAIWILLGAAIALPYRVPRSAKALALAVPLLGALAAYFAIYKPF